MVDAKAARLALVSILAAAPAAAQLAPSSDAPLDITSERFEGEDNLAVSTFIGDVQVVQEAAILTSDRLILVRDEAGDVTTITAIGDVRYSNGEEAISGDKAVYEEIPRTIVVTGEVVVTQGEQVMAGERLVYWVDTGRVRIEAPEGRRVRGVFRTKSLNAES
ncbi:MAG: LptA/OstA family protein [Parvularculaceae bacterium]